MEVFTIQENYLKKENQRKRKSPVSKCKKKPNFIETANALQMNLAINALFYTSLYLRHTLTANNQPIEGMERAINEAY